MLQPHKSVPKTTASHNELYSQIQTYLGTDITGENTPTNVTNSLFGQIFELVEVCGKGSYGTVLKVIDKRCNENVAIKV
jgi:hypothetical protein